MTTDEKRTTSKAKPAPKKAKATDAERKELREKQVAIAMKTRPTGRPGAATRPALLMADATMLSITAHDRCRRRGIRTFGVHFTCGEAVELDVGKLPKGAAERILRHPELIGVQFDKDGKRLTPEIKRPKPPKKRRVGSAALAKPRQTENVAGPAAAKRRGVKAKEPVKGSAGATNHPAPAAPAKAKTRRGDG